MRRGRGKAHGLHVLIRRIEKRREAELRAEGLWDEDDPTDETEGKA